VNANLTQALISIEVAKHFHDIRRYMNARAYSLKGPSLFVESYLEALALQ
jgi:hypothetical protein